MRRQFGIVVRISKNLVPLYHFPGSDPQRSFLQKEALRVCSANEESMMHQTDSRTLISHKWCPLREKVDHAAHYKFHHLGPFLFGRTPPRNCFTLTQFCPKISPPIILPSANSQWLLHETSVPEATRFLLTGNVFPRLNRVVKLEFRLSCSRRRKLMLQCLCLDLEVDQFSTTLTTLVLDTLPVFRLTFCDQSFGCFILAVFRCVDYSKCLSRHW